MRDLSDLLENREIIQSKLLDYGFMVENTYNTDLEFLREKFPKDAI